VLLIYLFNRDEPLFIAFGICVALLVLLTHQKNIKRLLNGNENKAKILPRHRRIS
jgi:glycerol-3-phosphate acyltransferase PlsY